MNQSDTVLTTSADQIMNETIANANTASRVGAMFNALIDSKINNDKIDTDSTMAANSDSLVASQKAIKTYIDSVAKFVKVSITSAEILQMFTTPKVLVAAPGAGKLIVPISFTFRINYLTTAYATNTNMIFGWGSTSGGALATYTSILAQSQNVLELNAIGSVFGVFGSNASLVNQPLTARVPTGNPTAGDSSIDWYITYMIITL
jgi:hypothetical protein